VTPSLRAPIIDLSAAFGQHTSTSETDHRPWPLPDRSWFMGQSWFDLLFAHWRVDADELARVVPPELPLDLVDGSAWIGITPFEVRAFRLRYTLPIPVLSVFPEVNVRTYVKVGGKPGIYFLSLDADSSFAVRAARRAYRFPYFRAAMKIERSGSGISYASERRDDSGAPAELGCDYIAEGPGFHAEPGTVEASLIERYCAYTLDDERRVQRAEIHHRLWELRRAQADFQVNTMTEQVGLPLEGEPMLHFSPRQDVVIWPLAHADR
jgi:uncharacterized protein YqjF (DUF2071 family)